MIALKTFGLRLFPAGVYCYCGSARGPGGLKARVDRHLRDNTKRFWHYDYLKDRVEVIQVWWQAGPHSFECNIAQFFVEKIGADIPVMGFGASDCRKGCKSHLIHFKNVSVINEMFVELKDKRMISERKMKNP